MLLGVASVTVVAAAVLGASMLLVQRDLHLREVELRARTLVEAAAATTTADLAAGHIEELDQTASRMVERDFATLDVKFIAVLDLGRRVVAHTRKGEYGRVAGDTFSGEAAAMDRPIVRVVERDGGRMLLASAPVESHVPGHAGIRWGTVVAGIGLERVQAGFMTLLLWTLVAAGVGLLLAAVATFWIVDSLVVRPVRELTHDAKRFAAGDLSTRAPTRRDDEIGTLAGVLDDMAVRLDSHTRTLEDEIRRRTQELEEANRRLSEANAALQGLATTDGLTGLFNYRHFATTLATEIHRSRRVGTPVSLLMLDVDHFKAFNDAHGHPAGDMVLREIARLIQSRLRRTDVACRYGGEEFAVILVDTDLADAAGVAGILRDLVERTRFPGEESQPGGCLTISVGVATFPIEASDADGLVKAADQALYRAKEGGRNRVEGGAGGQGSERTSPV
jgi:diguanylate cyclase (GGDEF)-like protein